MRSIFSEEGRRALTELATTRALLAFDYDGTLAPIVDDPKQASLREGTLKWLTRLAGRCPVAVISGRTRDDVMSRLSGVRLVAVVGNHGGEGEVGAGVGLVEAELDGMRSRLGEAIAGLEGVSLEDKRLSFAVHYRGTRFRRTLLRRVSKIVGESGGSFRLIDGKLVLNVVAAALPHKGDALAAILTAEELGSYFYVGDDFTDEDVFSGEVETTGVTVRVGATTRTKAHYFVRSQLDVDRLLRLLYQTWSGEGP